MLGEIIVHAVLSAAGRLVGRLDRVRRLPDQMPWEPSSIEAVLLATDPCHVAGPVYDDVYAASSEVVWRLCPIDLPCPQPQMAEALEAGLGRVKERYPQPGPFRRTVERLTALHDEAHSRWVSD